ncbi:hypothetical protein [Ornithinimicrobium sp. INDO-MA30-4]|uniref:hypothetical protein n=1 Tax=Ornithinimicrobium sp. INDO-MA30-4 TaxID=2908651 RepID=UPI001F419AD3|nr:hypothetical protein [Ornithinimicrobium sp. INDO-MA30-4]UJH71402.1 hypothetical protein L0A91_06670 [Ornithinimicrobium sp. INDO-MA30-4]
MTHHRPTSSALLLLVDQVQDVHADLGEPRIQATFDAVIDALGHALVDLADGTEAPLRTTPVVDVPGPTLALDPVSCSAAGAHLAQIATAIKRLSPPTTSASLSCTVCTVLEGLVIDLQRCAEPADPQSRARTRAQFHRQLRAWLAKLQPGDRLDA